MKLTPIVMFACLLPIAIYHHEAAARRPSADADSGHRAADTLREDRALPALGPASEPAFEPAADLAAYAPAFCTTRTLLGTYLFREEGFWAGEPYRSSGFEAFDGQGNVVGMANDSDTPEGFRFTGTYEIDESCRGTVRYSGGDSYAIFVAPNGAAIEFISTDRGAVLSGPARRVTFGLLVQ